MEENFILTRVAITSAIAVMAEVWGKIGWLIILWVLCFTMDYITGSLAAFRKGIWDSTVAREGLWHKGAMITVVLVAGLFDLSIKAITASVGIALPFDVFILPLVLSWYIITELGSVLENAIKMGAQKVPRWLKNGLKIVSDTIDATGESVAPTPQKKQRKRKNNTEV